MEAPGVVFGMPTSLRCVGCIAPRIILIAKLEETPWNHRLDRKCCATLQLTTCTNPRLRRTTLYRCTTGRPYKAQTLQLQCISGCQSRHRDFCLWSRSPNIAIAFTQPILQQRSSQLKTCRLHGITSCGLSSAEYHSLGHTPHFPHMTGTTCGARRQDRFSIVI